jgi:hypothetical protein
VIQPHLRVIRIHRGLERRILSQRRHLRLHLVAAALLQRGEDALSGVEAVGNRAADRPAHGERQDDEDRGENESDHRERRDHRPRDEPGRHPGARSAAQGHRVATGNENSMSAARPGSIRTVWVFSPMRSCQARTS